MHKLELTNVEITDTHPAIIVVGEERGMLLPSLAIDASTLPILRQTNFDVKAA